MDTETTKERLSAQTFREEAYSKMAGNRGYALSPSAKTMLGILARAMFQRRTAEGRNQPDAQPSPWVESSRSDRKTQRGRLQFAAAKAGRCEEASEIVG